MKPDWTMLLLWLMLALCSVALVGFLVLPTFGWIAATVAWVAMAALIGVVVRSLSQAANLRR